MNSRINIFAFFTITYLIGSCFPSNAQNTKSIFQESIILNTDRNVYSVGEEIHFFAQNIVNQQATNTEKSKVLYIEVITPWGKPIFQTKYIFDKTYLSDKFSLNKSVLTGTYYLRTYTKWMRNQSPYEYTYVPIQVINPFNNTALSNIFSTTNNTSSSPIIDTSSTPYFSIEHHKNIETNQDIEIDIKCNKQLMQNTNLSVSVVKSEYYKQIYSQNISKQSNYKTEVKYPIETTFASLTGTITDADKQPLKNKRLFLTVFSKKPTVFVTTSDTNGFFFFSLPSLSGDYECFITTEDKLEDGSSIMVNSDFCELPVKLPFIPFSPKSTDSINFNELNANAQLAQYFKAINTTDTICKDSAFFYGSPSQVIYLENYIPLPTISEYIEELLPSIKTIKKRKNPELVVMGIEPELSIYKPLVLVDLIPISNINNILNLNPSRLKNIEVINKPYHIGSNIFGGVIHFSSKNNDFAGIDLPKTSYFFEYRFIEPDTPNKSDESTSKDKIPDLRNTLFWSSDITSNFTNNYPIRFKTSQTPGDFSLIIKALLWNGEQIEEIIPLKVK